MKNSAVDDLQTALDKKPPSVKDLNWCTSSVLAMACCIFREKGFTATSTYIAADPGGDQRWTSKEMLIYALCPQLATKDFTLAFSPTPEDIEQAHAIVKHFRKLMFGIIADNNNDYMDRVFKTTQNATTTVSDFGVLASVPSVYDKEVAQKEIMTQIKNSINAWIGKEGEWTFLNVFYIENSYVAKLQCHHYLAITDCNHLVSFFSNTDLGRAGTVGKIRAKVKKHSVHFKTNTAETQLNYVKVIDTDFVWQ